MTEPVETELLQRLPQVLVALGLQPVDTTDSGVLAKNCYTALLDGRVIGRLPHASARSFAQKLRMLKIQGERVRSGFLQIIRTQHFLLLRVNVVT